MKLKLFKNLFLGFALTAFLIGCSSSDDSGSPDDPIDSVASITISSSSSAIDPGETVTFTVKTNTDEDVTSSTTFKVNGVEISGNSYTPQTSGAYSILATYLTFSDTFSLTVNDIVESISLSADNTYTIKDNSVTFSVIDNNNNDLTNASEISVNGAAISGNSYTFTAVGTFDVVATYDSGAFTSNTVTITVNNPFTKNVLIEDFTGTWCGWCPRVSYGIELVEQQTDQAVVVAVHNSDEMTNSTSTSVENAFGITGFPTAHLNRTTTWTYPEPSNIPQVVNLTGNDAGLGLKINSSVSGGNIIVDVKVKFNLNYTNVKLVVYLTEDGLVYDQTNYTSYYGGGSNIVGFVHDNVLLYSMTNVLGDIMNNTSVGDEHTAPYSFSIPTNVTNTANLKIVAFVTELGNTALNARVADLGETQSYEEN